MINAPSVAFADAPTLPSSGIYTGSPRKLGRAYTHVTPAREGLVPLGAAKTIAALTSRRGVNFSPSNDTKYFLASDTILPLKDAPPPSIRAYPDPPSSDPLDLYPSTPSAGPSRSSTPVNGRSILKSRVQDIRVAASVEEGTLNNKEAARLIVCGKRPRLVTRDSFTLAMIRGAAGEDMDKGKGKAVEPEDLPAPSSDDTSASDDAHDDARAQDGSSEVEEEVEETGPLATSSLVSIILDGAEDLLTLEEAYSVLTTNLRSRIPVDVAERDIPPILREEINLAITSIRDEAPAMVRAMLRDLQRVLGKVPNSETALEADDTPFRGLMPLRDTTPTHRSRSTPAGTPSSGNRRIATPELQPTRKGYNEAEVRYRREAAGVGSAALKFLALALHTPIIFRCFSTADTTALLEQVMVILRTPSLPTPNPKRTYYTSLTVLAQMQVPTPSVLPIKEKISRALESALSDGLGGSPVQSPGAKDNNGQIKKEAFIAVTNLLATYPDLFLPHYADLLPACLRYLHSPSPLFRSRASAAVAAFTTAKLNALSPTPARDTWSQEKATTHRMETFVVNHLKSAARPTTRGMLHVNAGEKRTEWLELERVFKDTVGTAEGVTWACATWANLVCLMGSAFANSGLASSFNHIMDRSLQPSTNVVRPLLARIAWSHAIYAYMCSGMMISIADDFSLVASYKPFVQTSAGDYGVSTVQMCVNLSMSLAADPGSAEKVVTDGKCAWERLEKTKKAKWMCQTGLGAAAVVYAYSGTALYHQEQPAKELTAVTGLPSSDGAPVAESVKEEAMFERLDKVWERVAHPLLKKYVGLRGVDRLKAHGWAIVDAITSTQSPIAEAWSLDRLLSAKYLSGELFAAEKTDKEEALAELLDSLESGPVRAADIPSWGVGWMVRRMDKLLDLYQDMLSGIYGIADMSLVKWQRDVHGHSILPLSLYKIWTNLLRAIAFTPRDTVEYTHALRLVARHLILIFAREPSTHVPLASLNSDGTCKMDVDTQRLSLFELLLEATIGTLGRDAIGAIRIPRSETGELDATISDLAFGSDAAKSSTMVGMLLGQILHAKSLRFPLTESATAAFDSVIRILLKTGCITRFSGKLLGDITNQMPFLFQDQENLQLIVWRQLALRWVEVIDVQPAASTTNGTNHTGALLVSLLSCPFRSRSVDSVWHQSASKDDFAAWQVLLKVTVLRFRARGVGSNLGVLESLAAHLGDFFETSLRTSSSTITLSCLNAAMGYVSFVEPKAHHADHFSISENYVPADFLTLVSNALVESYPTPDTLVLAKDQVAISPAVFDLLATVQACLETLPADFVWPVIQHLRDGMAVWLQDDAKLVRGDRSSAVLDGLYISVLSVISNAVQFGTLERSAGTMDELIQLFAPRLSRAQSASVPIAFKEFYERCFSTVRAEELSDGVKAFFEDVLAAVPGMIEVPGLLVTDTFSQAESAEKYPHAQSLALLPKEPDRPEDVLVNATDAEITVDPSGVSPSAAEAVNPDVAIEVSQEYDADVSQTPSQIVPHITVEKGKERAQPPLSPIASEPEVEESTVAFEQQPVVDQDVSLEPSATEDDVFGPTKAAPKFKGAKRSRKRTVRSRPLGDADSVSVVKRSRTLAVEADSSQSLPSLPGPAALVLTSSDQVEGETEEECIVASSPPSNPPSVVRNSRSSKADEHHGPTPAMGTAIQRSSSVLRHGLLGSARDWFVGVFKSPTTPSHVSENAQAHNQVIDLTVEDEGPGGEYAPAEEVHYTDTLTSTRFTNVDDAKPALGSVHLTSTDLRPSSRAASPPARSVTTSVRRSRRRGGRRQTSEAVIQPPAVAAEADHRATKGNSSKRRVSEEEDELLLSPESAVKRRKEEEGDIASAALARTSQPNVPSAGKIPVSIRTRSRTLVSASREVVSASQSSSGRFEDAEETQRNETQPQQQIVPQIPPTPSQRPTRQTRLLRMMQEASESHEVIEEMDLEGVLDFTRYLDRMRVSVQANLERRAIAEKAQRKSRK